MLDPFLPEKAEDVARLKAIQDDIHEMFIELVKRSRGARIKGDDDVLFSGAFWTGQSRSTWPERRDRRPAQAARALRREGEMPVIAPATGLLSGLLGRSRRRQACSAALDGSRACRTS